MTVVATRIGRVRGLEANGIEAFLGIPYAAAPLDGLRLRSPRPATSWSGERDCTTIGAASLQALGGAQTWLNEPIARQSEDCLFLNLWSPGRGGAHAVLVWFHGGATRNGHGGSASIDGVRLAREQGIVVVTVNYRLGALGGLAHPGLADEETGECANWGLQDKVAALRWVRENIAAFGGDPDRVAIGGQSSGAANAVLIAQNPAWQGLFARVVAQSPPLFQPPMFVALDAAAEYTEALARRMGTSVRGLREQPGESIFRAEAEWMRDPSFAQAFGRPRTAPVLDGRTVAEWPVTGRLADVPLLTGWTRDEANFWYRLVAPDGKVLSAFAPPADATALEREVARLVRLHYPYPDAPMPAEAVAAAGKGAPARIWCELYTDLVFRAPIRHCALRHATRGSPAFVYEYARPIAPPGEGSPHACEVPLVFGTLGHPHLAAKVGASPEAEALSARMRGRWGAFVRDGVPGDWPAFEPGRRAVLRLGAERGDRVEDDPRTSALAVWRALYTT